MTFIPYGRQHITENDIKAVVDVLKSDFITQGPAIEKFETGIRDYTSAKHCLAFNSATSALHVACLSLGVGAGDLVWTTPISFVASSNCALYCGADVDFVDIDDESFNICINELSKRLKKAAEDKKLPKVLICVHLAGQSCDMQEIYELCSEYDVKIIEDASHAIGGSYKDVKIGSCKYSDITIFSFHPVKIVTTGEGGALLTNSDELHKKASLLRTHGITKQETDFIKESDGPWYYEQQILGFNYRITDIQAALGFSQLQRLDEYIKRRNEIALYYNEKLQSDRIQTPVVGKSSVSAFHLYIIRVSSAIQENVFKYLRSKNIGVNLHYIPIHTQPYYEDIGFKEGMFPKAEAYYKKAISIPMFPNLTEEELEYICESIHRAVDEYTI